MAGHLEIIVGPMFSGKSSMLLSRIRKHKVLGRRTLVINHESDTRYGSNKVITHDFSSEEAHPVASLMHVRDPCDDMYNLYETSQTIFIEEAQWFADLEEFVRVAVIIDHKFVCVCGLDGDYNMQPFQNVINLIPFAEEVTKCRALCRVCNDGTEASFTKCLVRPRGRQHVGGSELYAAVCRAHHPI
eukprot:gene19582-26265_t